MKTYKPNHLAPKPLCVTAQLNITNLLDKQYYANSDGARGNIMPGAPRSFMGSLKFEY